MEKKSVKKLADAKNPTIEAVIKELFKFTEEESAANRIALIKKNFVISKEQAEDGRSVRLWVRGYALDGEEKKKGYTGNFILISYYKNDDGKFVLRGSKEIAELKLHPHKERPKKTHPDWGHPVLKAVKAKKVYKDIESANAALNMLMEEFPDIAIPGVNKLYIMVYEKTEAGTTPVQKYILDISSNENGEFIIKSNLNERKKAPPMPTMREEKREIKGKFTTMVEVRRKKKKRK